MSNNPRIIQEQDLERAQKRLMAIISATKYRVQHVDAELGGRAYQHRGDYKGFVHGAVKLALDLHIVSATRARALNDDVERWQYENGTCPKCTKPTHVMPLGKSKTVRRQCFECGWSMPVETPQVFSHFTPKGEGEK